MAVMEVSNNPASIVRAIFIEPIIDETGFDVDGLIRFGYASALMTKWCSGFVGMMLMLTGCGKPPPADPPSTSSSDADPPREIEAGKPQPPPPVPESRPEATGLTRK
ncbi:MAG: hypothetical protein AAF492_30325, partial [Verrucomicrobiota bacterium]